MFHMKHFDTRYCKEKRETCLKCTKIVVKHSNFANKLIMKMISDIINTLFLEL